MNWCKNDADGVVHVVDKVIDHATRLHTTTCGMVLLGAGDPERPDGIGCPTCEPPSASHVGHDDEAALHEEPGEEPAAALAAKTSDDHAEPEVRETEDPEEEETPQS